MAIMSVEVWVDQNTRCTRAVRVEGKKLSAIEIDSVGAVRPGSVFVAKVLRVNTTLDTAELELGDGQKAFLSLRRKPLKPGALVEVEWLAPAVGTKDIVVKLLPTAAKGEPRLLREGPDAIARLGEVARLRVTTPKLQRLYPTAELDDKLFEMLDMEAQIADLLAREVEITNGQLVFDHTEVGHVIDVNGTARAETLNRAAIAEIARQVRLRNLSGIILVDLVGDMKKYGKVLLEQMRAAVADDPCKVEVFGITKLGLLEMTRQRRGYALSSLLKDCA